MAIQHYRQQLSVFEKRRTGYPIAQEAYQIVLVICKSGVAGPWTVWQISLRAQQKYGSNIVLLWQVVFWSKSRTIGEGSQLISSVTAHNSSSAVLKLLRLNMGRYKNVAWRIFGDIKLGI
jgi:hypothetical protein